MLKDAIEIMRFIVCPSCNTRSIREYVIDQLKHEYKAMVVGNPINAIENMNVNLHLTCSNCQFTIKIINKEWLKIFYKHAFGG